jgi:prophage regulatory protein
MSETILRLPQVSARVGLSRSAIYERIAEHKFPRPIALGDGFRAVGWPQSVIDTWIAERISASQEAA